VRYDCRPVRLYLESEQNGGQTKEADPGNANINQDRKPILVVCANQYGSGQHDEAGAYDAGNEPKNTWVVRKLILHFRIILSESLR
jgi:hypothetical protein